MGYERRQGNEASSTKFRGLIRGMPVKYPTIL
jgi:hypothetical protein